MTRAAGLLAVLFVVLGAALLWPLRNSREVLRPPEVSTTKEQPPPHRVETQTKNDNPVIAKGPPLPKGDISNLGSAIKGTSTSGSQEALVENELDREEIDVLVSSTFVSLFPQKHCGVTGNLYPNPRQESSRKVVRVGSVRSP